MTELRARLGTFWARPRRCSINCARRLRTKAVSSARRRPWCLIARCRYDQARSSVTPEGESLAQGARQALNSALASALADGSRGHPESSALALIQVAETGSRPVLASASDGRNYWLKWPGNPHGILSLAHEMIVARVGRLIGAPVRPV